VERAASRAKLALSLGGANADFTSHLNVVSGTIHDILHPLSVTSYAATGILLENLIKGRPDYHEMLGCLASLLRRDDDFIAYLEQWIKGHFLPLPPVVASFQNYNARLERCYPRPLASPYRRLPAPVPAAINEAA